MQRAVKQANPSEAKWAVDKLTWQRDYMNAALRLRSAVFGKKFPAEVEVARTALRRLTKLQADDGTCAPGWQLHD